jgi:pSer/pThr/pTyr-binding forkhead associated (FHA) protein
MFASMGRTRSGDTATQEQGTATLPTAIRWLAPEAVPVTTLGLRPIIVGRGRRSHLVIDDKFLSERHLEIRPEDGAFVLEDLRSKNGTFVNGKRVSKTLLRPGDVIRLGSAVGYVCAEAPTETILSDAGQVEFARRLETLSRAWRLSPAQTKMLGRVVFGEPNKVIAGLLQCSDSNVEAHVSAILAAVRAGNRTELVAKFWTASI